MATIKSYTDLSQSKKLAEILPLESADMYYLKHDTIHANTLYSSCDRQYFHIHEYTPCWSLAGLLSVIPKPDLVQNSEGTWLIRSWVNAYPWSVGGYSNTVDACVAMIEKLHELKML